MATNLFIDHKLYISRIKTLKKTYKKGKINSNFVMNFSFFLLRNFFLEEDEK